MPSDDHLAKPTTPVCSDCGMRHDPDDRSACIEGHGEDDG